MLGRVSVGQVGVDLSDGVVSRVELDGLSLGHRAVAVDNEAIELEADHVGLRVRSAALVALGQGHGERHAVSSGVWRGDRARPEPAQDLTAPGRTRGWSGGSNALEPPDP